MVSAALDKWFSSRSSRRPSALLPSVALLAVCFGTMNGLPAEAGEVVTAKEHASPPRPWELSWQERINARFHPVDQTERREAFQAKIEARSRGSQRAADKPAATVIDGERNPELFVGWELFDQLILSTFAQDARIRSVWRDVYQRRADEPDLDESFWRELEEVASPFLELRAEGDQLLKELENASAEDHPRIRAQLQALDRPLCRTRAQALAKARAHFGRETFDRFLYQAVASSLVQRGDSTARELEWVAGGCE